MPFSQILKTFLREFFLHAVIANCKRLWHKRSHAGFETLLFQTLTTEKIDGVNRIPGD